MRVLRNKTNYLFLLLLLQFEFMKPHQVDVKVILFNHFRPPPLTQALCAVTHGDVMQANDKKVTECSYDCAVSEDCVSFNYKEPQLVCELFQSPAVNVIQTDGCTHYEVRCNTSPC